MDSYLGTKTKLINYLKINFKEKTEYIVKIIENQEFLKDRNISQFLDYLKDGILSNELEIRKEAADILIEILVIFIDKSK